MGKMQESGLTEIIPLICISATWGQVACAFSSWVSSGWLLGWGWECLQGKHCFHPEFPQGSLSLRWWLDGCNILFFFTDIAGDIFHSHQPQASSTSFITKGDMWRVGTDWAAGCEPVPFWRSLSRQPSWKKGTHLSEGGLKGTETWGAFITKWILRAAPKGNHVGESHTAGVRRKSGWRIQKEVS